MNSQLLFGFQVVMSLIVFGLVARWYLRPALARVSVVQALTPLLLFHATRYVGATFLTPSVIDPDAPAAFSVPGAVGDLLTVFLALVALWALRRGSRLTLPLLWVFNIVGTLDFINAFYLGISLDLTRYQLGATWFIPTVLVPAYLIVHMLVFEILIRRSSELPRITTGRTQTVSPDAP
jgi:hypothetical protein